MEIIRILNINNEVVQVKIDEFPNQCPYCHNFIDPKYITGTQNDHLEEEDILQTVFRCTYKNCCKIFISYYYYDRGYGDYLFSYNQLGNIKTEQFSPHINKISPEFSHIYNQAYASEQHLLKQICGMGYRKSLEFLIKDYLIFKSPEEEEIYKKEYLGPCIKRISNDKIKEMAKRATWLGNDETHYIRKWTEKDLTHLKKLINVVIHYIEMEIVTDEFLNEMPE